MTKPTPQLTTSIISNEKEEDFTLRTNVCRRNNCVSGLNCFVK